MSVLEFKHHVLALKIVVLSCPRSNLVVKFDAENQRCTTTGCPRLA